MYVYVAAGDGTGAGKTNAIVVSDEASWKPVGQVTTQGTSPDWIAVDPAGHRLYAASDDNNRLEIYSEGAHPTLEAKWPLLPANAKSGPDAATLLAPKREIFQSDDSDIDLARTADGKVTAHVDTGAKLSAYDGKAGVLGIFKPVR
jgi:DNA-binding beta-propeller fold protein YncE